MCNIDTHFKKLVKSERYAWKAFDDRRPPTATHWHPWAMTGRFKTGRWVKARSRIGFNSFPTRKAALAANLSNTVIRVRIRGIQGTGRAWGETVLFSREIFVPKPKRSK